MSTPHEQALIAEEMLGPERQAWALGGVPLELRANRPEIVQIVSQYMQGFEIDMPAAVGADAAADVGRALQVHAYERAPLEPPENLQDWPRETGKKGRKDAWVEQGQGVARARLVYKLRTGMCFLQQDAVRIAAGPCLANDNQLINFINAQWMNHFQQQGYVIGHAAALVRDGRALAIAGLSGGGKSTLMLKLLARQGAFMSNDRLFLKAVPGGVHTQGIAKWPRVNPGTIVHDEHLRHLLPAARRDALLALPSAQLRALEEKYDVFVPTIYGPDRVSLQAPLAALLVLNWAPDSTEATRLRRVPLRDELLPALMKSPGPFYQKTDGSFWPPLSAPDPAVYRQLLAGCPIFELNGRVDFERAAELCGEVCWG